MKRNVGSRDESKRGLLAGQFVEVIEDAQQTRTTPFVTEEVRAVRLAISMQRNAGASGLRPLKKATCENDVWPHQFGQEVDHGRIPDQLRSGTAVPLWLYDPPCLLLAIAGVRHFGIGQFLFQSGDQFDGQDFGEHNVSLDFEMPDLLRPAHGGEVGLVDIHEVRFVRQPQPVVLAMAPWNYLTDKPADGACVETL